MPGTAFSKFPEYAPDSYDAAHELEKKQMEEHKAKTKGGAFKVHTALDAQPFTVNP